MGLVRSMDKLSLQNPVFATYVIAATIMILKAVSMSWLTVVRMMQVKGGFRSPEDIKKTVDTGACWATWSVPFDHEEEFFFVATAYYLSPAVRTFWEKQLGGPILWFGTTLEAVADYLEKQMGAEAAGGPNGAPVPAAAVPATAGTK